MSAMTAQPIWPTNILRDRAKKTWAFFLGYDGIQEELKLKPNLALVLPRIRFFSQRLVNIPEPEEQERKNTKRSRRRTVSKNECTM